MWKSQLIIKEDGVLAGVEMAKRIFHDFDPELKMTVFIQDGAEVKKGDIASVSYTHLLMQMRMPRHELGK